MTKFWDFVFLSHIHVFVRQITCNKNCGFECDFCTTLLGIWLSVLWYAFEPISNLIVWANDPKNVLYISDISIISSSLLVLFVSTSWNCLANNFSQNYRLDWLFLETALVQPKRGWSKAHQCLSESALQFYVNHIQHRQ